MARLERHLAVHQCFGAYVCPLCGKTFKYEYNLFYHWRRTCRDLNEMMTVEERKVWEIILFFFVDKKFFCGQKLFCQFYFFWG